MRLWLIIHQEPRSWCPQEKMQCFPAATISAYSYHDRNLAEIRSMGWSEWKLQSGYYIQNHTENAFYRYKKIIDGRIRVKNDETQMDRFLTI